MGPLAQRLKALWVERVRALTGAETYRIGRRWNPTFEKAADLLREVTCDPQEFVDAQIQHVISRNEPNKLWPTLLTGRAMERYLNRRLRPADELIDYYENQAQLFSALLAAIGFEAALAHDGSDFSPLWLAYMRMASGLEVPADLADDARREIRAHTPEVVGRIFPPALIQGLLHGTP